MPVSGREGCPAEPPATRDRQKGLRSLLGSMMTLAVVLIGGVLAFIFCCTAVYKQRRADADFTERAAIAVDVLETSLSAILQRDERQAIRSRLVPLLKDPDFRRATVVDGKRELVAVVARDPNEAVDPRHFDRFIGPPDEAIGLPREIEAGSEIVVVRRLMNADGSAPLGHIMVHYSRDRMTARIRSELVMWVTGAILLLVIIMTILLIVLVRVTTPLDKLGKVLLQIADGELSVDIPGCERADEIGTIARTIAVFKSKLADGVSMQHEKDKARSISMDRQKSVEAVVSTFRTGVDEALRKVTLQSDQMTTAADGLSAVATKTTDRAHDASVAINQASESVRTVAHAAEELSVSIAEIENQVERTRGVVQEASRTTAGTSVTIDGLAAKAREISEITGLIQSIAAQTNLLSLNATIEAARAGESGRGFAVVAQEVKTLATQTSKASQRIAEHVEAIQTATAEAVAAIASIGSTMSAAEGYAATISVAMQQQATATTQISRSVADAARGAESAAASMTTLAAAVGNTDKSAAQVHHAASDVAAQAKYLRETVDGFLRSTAA